MQRRLDSAAGPVLSKQSLTCLRAPRGLMAARRLSSDERRAQIARVAATLFSRKGFDGVTTREIARKARVSEAIVFRHFPTKEALYTEIIHQKVRMQPESFDLAALSSGDDAEVFRSVARTFFRQVEEDSTILRLMLYSALEDHQLADVFLKSRESQLFDFLLDHVGRRIADGAFRKADPAVVVRAFVGMFFHFIMAGELFRVPKKLVITKDEAIAGFVDIFLNGIRA